jgi:hypothetical protein
MERHSITWWMERHRISWTTQDGKYREAWSDAAKLSWAWSAADDDDDGDYLLGVTHTCAGGISLRGRGGA